jgi:SP family sugar:H+ symporter-like MFS transporter
MGIAGALVPVYQAECAPASCRGSLVTVYTWCCDAGALIASGIVYGTHALDGPIAYKTVMGVQMIFPILLLAALPMIPETPRWLVMKGRREEALVILKQLRTSDEIAELEIMDVEASLEMHTDDGSWLDLFRGTNLRRTIISVVLPSIEAWQGQSFMGNYLIVFLIALGATNQYLLSLMLQATLFIMVTLLFWAPDYIGRRPMLLTGSIIMWVTMFITAGVSGHDSTNISNTRKQTAVGMLFIWAVTYACTWQTLGFIAPAEIPTTKLKTKTSGMAYFAQQCGGLIITFISPYMQNAGYGDMGPYIGFFFGSFSFIGIIFVYFCFPETKGATIEELDMFFEQRLPTSQFGPALKAVKGQHAIQGYMIDGHGHEKDVEMQGEMKNRANVSTVDAEQ